jgi:hypothetical protein
MAISNLTTTLTNAGNQGSAGDYSSTGDTAPFQISYANIGYTPSTINAYENDFGAELRLFVNGVRIYRLSGDTVGDDTTLSVAQKARLDALNTSVGNQPWTINTTGKYVQINKTHTVWGDTHTDNCGYPALSAWYIIKIVRIKSDKTTLSTNFQNASVLTESQLDNAFLETFHIAQEAFDTTATGSLTKDTDDIWNAQNIRIKNVSTPTGANDATTKAYVDGSSTTVTVAGIASNVTTVAGISGNVTTVAGIASNVTAVAGDATDIGAVAGKATEIGRLGTADAVADLAILGTTDIVADMAILATTDVVTDMNVLATADIVNDMNVLGTTDNVSNMNTVADNISNVNTVATNIGTISAKVSKSGDTMTGALTLSGAPASANHATTKTYVDTQDTTTETNALSNSIVFSIALG